jgi:hypothetical protein
MPAAATPTDVFAAFCGVLGVGWRFLEGRDPQSKGVVERLQGYLETSFEPAAASPTELDFQEQLDRWFDGRANVRFHRTLRCRPADRLAEERVVMRALPGRLPDVDRRFVTRVPPDPDVRVDSNDYSLDPRLVGRRVEVRISQREILAGALDTGELVCRTCARSRATGRSPRSSTPARSGSCAVVGPSRRSRLGRSPATTG